MYISISHLIEWRDGTTSTSTDTDDEAEILMRKVLALKPTTSGNHALEDNQLSPVSHDGSVGEFLHYIYFFTKFLSK